MIMNKTEEFYKNILKKRVVNREDIKDISKKVLNKKGDGYYYRKYLHKLMNERKVGKIRQGIYYGIPLDQIGDDFQADRYIIGHKIEKGHALGYHTALELHGSAYSAYTRVFILVKKGNRFREFEFQGVKYVSVVNKHDIGHITTLKYKDTQLDVTDRARTFVDCLSREDLSGGWEECLKSLANLKGISVPDISDVLSSYNNKTLELKCGYVLELLSKHSPFYEHISKDELHSLRPRDDWKPVYIDRDVPSKLEKEWGLYVPEKFEGLLRGI